MNNIYGSEGCAFKFQFNYYFVENMITHSYKNKYIKKLSKRDKNKTKKSVDQMINFNFRNVLTSSALDYTIDSDGEEHIVSTPSDSVHQSFSRTSLLLLDYKQFLAARRIQTLWRGHNVRKLNDRRVQAAITIQRWWRGFSVRRNYKSSIEERLQQALIDRYNEAATKIQSLFRGWHVRQTVHDMNSLRNMQHCAAEELLSCLAHKLHHLLRTYSIPGVYSLRNSHCLSKVEKLLTSMTYRFHNVHVAYNHARKASLSRYYREQFMQNKYHTKVPYSGPNFNSLCKPACEESVFTSKDMDRRMYKIIAEYEKGQVDPNLNKLQRSVADHKFRKRVEQILAAREKVQSDFCADVIESMRKWKIWDGQLLTINNDVFRNPENLESFLADAAKLIDQYQATCHCQITNFDELYCF